MSNKELATKEKNTVQKRDSSPVTEAVFVPLVDIMEDNEAYYIRAEMPGVDFSSANVTVENDILTIEGNPSCENPAGYELAGQEFCIGRYRRNFSLSNEIDVANIKARMRNGILDVRLPKNQASKTKKIEIEA